MILCLDLVRSFAYFFDNVNEIEGRTVVVKHLGAVSIGDHVHDCTPKETQSSTLALIQL